MSLASEFQPAGTHPEWWPVAGMRTITPEPTTWVKIVEQTPGPAPDIRRCALVSLTDVPEVLGQHRSLVGEVGDVEVFEDRFHDGLTDPFRRNAEFFCQVRWLEFVDEPSVEWAWPFLWYWKAVRQGDSWIYLNAAGRDVELARIRVENVDQYVVEVRAMELREYLYRRKMVLLIDVQLNDDYPDVGLVEREEHPFECEWASMAFVLYSYDNVAGREIAASSLHGQYIVRPAENAVGPSWCSDDKPEYYPDFVYGIDPLSGRSLTVAPTEENAGSDGYPGPFFSTRIYFQPQVLDRYLVEPGRYNVTASRITCLTKWSLSIGCTSDNLVEVDLYDLSRMPWQEWSHWKTHNVPPMDGTPDEGKLRREHFNQMASSPDVVRELRAALQRANSIAQQYLGWMIWRPLDGQMFIEWQALHAPVVTDRAALQGPILTLSKTLVDTIDSVKLRKTLTSKPDPNARTLVLLQRYVEQLGGNPDVVQPLKDLQTLRSRGGIAHYSGSGADDVLAQIAGDARTPAEVFTKICAKLTGSLNSIAVVLQDEEI